MDTLYIKIFLSIFLFILTILYILNQVSQLKFSKLIYKIVWLLVYLSFSIFFLVIWKKTRTIPLANFAQAFYLALFFLVLSSTIIETRLKKRSFFLFILPILFLLSILGLFLQDFGKSLPIAMQSLYWPIHVTSALASYTFFFIAFIASISFLAKHYQMKNKSSNLDLLTKTPSLELIKRFMFLYSQLGIFFLSLGIITGGLWMIQLDMTIEDALFPKTIFALFTWFYFFALLITKSKFKIFGKKAAYAILFGFVFVILTFSIGNHAF